MNKYFKPAIILFSLLFFSGCNGSNGSQTFTLSPSIWKSTDGGKTWEAKINGVGPANIKNIDVLSVAVNPSDSQNVYVGLRKGGILTTNDEGNIWRFMNFLSEKVYGLAVGFNSGQTLYASGVWQGTGKIFKTEDAGENWKEIYTSPGAGPIVISITLDKNNPEIVYATTSENEVLKSDDGGQSWKNIHNADSPVLAIAVDTNSSSLIYAITDSGQLFRSRDGGKTLENITVKVNNISSGFAGHRFKIAKADPIAANKVYLAGEGGIAASSDAGETWQIIPVLNNSQKFPITAFSASSNISNALIYGAAQASYVSLEKNGQIDWVTFQFDTPKSINVINYDPQNPQAVYAGFSK